jgi:hypothetical protein
MRVESSGGCPERVRPTLEGEGDAAAVMERVLIEVGLTAEDYTYTADERGDATLIKLPLNASKSRSAYVSAHRLLPAARGDEAGAYLTAADTLHEIGRTEHAASVRRLIQHWAAADDARLCAIAAHALGRRSGRMEPGEAAALLTTLAARSHSLIAAAVSRACVLAAVGEAADDPRGAWVFQMLEGWIGHHDIRIRRAAGRALMALAADLEREGDPRAAAVKYKVRQPDQVTRPDQVTQDSIDGDPVTIDGQAGDPDSPESRHPVGRPGSGAPEEGPAPWPGLVWFGEIDPRVGRSVAALWRLALVSPRFAGPAGRALDLCARRVEPYPERREALVRLAARTSAGREPGRGAIALLARRWVGRPDSAAPRTGTLMLAVLDPAYAAARNDAGGHTDPDAETAQPDGASGRRGQLPSPRRARPAQQHRVRNASYRPRRSSGRHPAHDHRCR